MKTSIGDKYENWTVIDGPIVKRANYYWLCRCTCGTEREVFSGSLQAKRSKGCVRCNSKKPKNKFGAYFVGVPKSVLYKLRGAAKNAFNRCNDSKSKQYHDYGGRGIKVCFVDVISFVKHLLTLEGYDNLELVIDRIDNNGHYEVGNLRFTTRLESSRNSRKRKHR